MNFKAEKKPLKKPTLVALEQLKWCSPTACRLRYSKKRKDSSTFKECRHALESIGGVFYKMGWVFDYPAKPVVDEIVINGCVPDKRSHQYYPTPEVVAEAAIAAAEISPRHYCLEPSAGQGHIAKYMVARSPNVHAVEISPLHEKILKGEDGLNVYCADFMEWRNPIQFDRIVMNPPYSEGRAMAHLERALTMLAPGGRLVAVLPESFKRRAITGDGHWLQTFNNEFTGTSISVAIYVVDM